MHRYANQTQLNGRQGRQNNKYGPSGRKKFKGHKTYGKKGNKRRDKQMRAGKLAHKSAAVAPQPMPSAVADGGPLIRLFEGIVVDWDEDAWETVFGNNSRRPDAEQGSRTFLDLQTVPDAALRIKQRRRASRRNRGLMLEECLDKFEQAEVLSQQDMWYCPRCKEHRRASKKFDLWKTPDILVVHLNRFSSSGWRRDKLDVHVEFPIEGLDLTSRVIAKEDGKQEVYDLIGVDDHFGGLGGGHYTAYAKNFVDKRWYSYNGKSTNWGRNALDEANLMIDSSVHVVSDPASVVTSAAYLLFYRRRSSRHLGGPHFDAVFEKYDSEGMQSDNEATESGDEANSNLRGHKLGGKAAIKSLGDSGQEEMPGYSGSAIRRSIEDDGIVMSGKDQPSLDMTQDWSFTALGNKKEGDANGGDGSDQAQFESSADERERAGSEHDTDMASVDRFGEESAAWDNSDAILSVPAADGVEEGNSDDVTEIHIDGNKTSGGE